MVLFLWYLSGIPIAYVMQDACSVGAPGTWARAFRVFLEGIVAFGLGGFIYVSIKNFSLTCRHFTVCRRWAGAFSQSTIHAGWCCRTSPKRCHRFLWVPRLAEPQNQSNCYSVPITCSGAAQCGVLGRRHNIHHPPYISQTEMNLAVARYLSCVRTYVISTVTTCCVLKMPREMRGADETWTSVTLTRENR